MKTLIFLSAVAFSMSSFATEIELVVHRNDGGDVVTYNSKNKPPKDGKDYSNYYLNIMKKMDETAKAYDKQHPGNNQKLVVDLVISPPSEKDEKEYHKRFWAMAADVRIEKYASTKDGKSKRVGISSLDRVGQETAGLRTKNDATAWLDTNSELKHKLSDKLELCEIERLANEASLDEKKGSVRAETWAVSEELQSYGMAEFIRNFKWKSSFSDKMACPESAFWAIYKQDPNGKFKKILSRFNGEVDESFGQDFCKSGVGHSNYYGTTAEVNENYKVVEEKRRFMAVSSKYRLETHDGYDANEHTKGEVKTVTYINPEHVMFEQTSSDQTGLYHNASPAVNKSSIDGVCQYEVQ